MQGDTKMVQVGLPDGVILFNDDCMAVVNWSHKGQHPMLHNIVNRFMLDCIAMSTSIPYFI